MDSIFPTKDEQNADAAGGSGRADLSQADRRAGWPAAILIALAIMAVYLFMAGQSTLWDRDEPAFARATVEMVQSGNYLYPTFNGHLRADKPILIYWLMSVPVRILGGTELACRFFSPIGTAVACLLIYFIGRRLFDRSTGLLAMVIYSLVPLTGMIGTAATADAVMIAFNLGVLAVAAVAISAPAWKWWHVPAMGILFGGAMLTKSAFGVMPLMAIVGIAAFSLILQRDKPFSHVLRENAKLLALTAVAAVIGGLIFLAWFIPANNATGGDFFHPANGELFKLHFGKHVAGRATAPMVGHGGGGLKYFAYLPFYLVVVVLGFFPWTLFLPGAISATLGGRVGGKDCSGGRGRAFLAGWVVAIFVPLTLVATKFPHYALMFVPALALAVAGTIRAAAAGRLTDRDRKWMRIGMWIFVPVAAALALASTVGSWVIQIPGLAFSGTLVGLIAGSMAYSAFRDSRFATRSPQGVLDSEAKAVAGMGRFRARGLLRAALVLVTMMVLLQLMVAGLVVPAIEPLKVSAPIARAVNDATAHDVPVATCGYDEPSLNFYLDRPINQGHVRPAKPGQPSNHPTPLTVAEAADWLNRPGPGVLVITRKALEKINLPPGPITTRPIATAKGFNYSTGEWIELVALERR